MESKFPLVLSREAVTVQWILSSSTTSVFWTKRTIELYMNTWPNCNYWFSSQTGQFSMWKHRWNLKQNGCQDTVLRLIEIEFTRSKEGTISCLKRRSSSWWRPDEELCLYVIGGDSAAAISDWWRAVPPGQLLRFLLLLDSTLSKNTKSPFSRIAKWLIRSALIDMISR